MNSLIGPQAYIADVLTSIGGTPDRLMIKFLPSRNTEKSRQRAPGDLQAIDFRSPGIRGTEFFNVSLILQLSLEVRRGAIAAPFPMTDLGGGLMQASPE